MRRRNLWLALLLLALFSCRREEELTLLQRLQRIPGVTATASEPLPCYAQAFQVDVTQPVDHTQAGRGEFRQRLYLSYRGRRRRPFSIPAAMASAGTMRASRPPCCKPTRC